MAAESDLKEVISLQVGNYSNFIGAHFWNLQDALRQDYNVGREDDEINHGILYRERQNISGERRYQPRVICFDFKGSVSNVIQDCDGLSDNVLEDGASAWEGAVEKYDRGLNESGDLLNDLRREVHTSIATSQSDGGSPFNINDKVRPLEGVVSSWSDYSLSRFHDKSLQFIENSQNDEWNFFDNFGHGELLFESRKFRDGFEDKLHFFAEECDRLQGFQIFADIQNCFGGLTSGILEELTEEYTKKNRLCFATMPAAFPDETTRQAADQRILNILLGFAKYVETTSQTVPLCLSNSFGLRNKAVELPWIDYEPTVNYHTSAVLAMAIDTATLPYRLRDPSTVDMNTLTQSISLPRRNISALSVGIPVPINSVFTLKELLKEYKYFSNNLTSLTPDVIKSSNIFSQSAVIRGLPSHLLKKTDHAQAQNRLSSILQSHAKQYHPGSNSGLIVQRPCMLTPLFPDIFNPSVTPVGCVVEDYSRPQQLAVHRTSVMTSLQNCEEVSNLLQVLIAGAKQANIKKYPGFLEAGIEVDDVKNSIEDLTVTAQTYYSKYEL